MERRDMEKRIVLERRGREPGNITELNLDNCHSTSIAGLTDEYSALESLSLINVGLTTLKGFPKLPNLKKLELSDNRISNGLNLLHTSPKLQYLNLSGNKIKDLEALKPLKEFQHLVILDLFNNEATQIENYREKTFELLPSLKFLDGFDCNYVEAPSEGEDEEDSESDNSGDDEDAGSDDFSEDDDNGDVSLAEVYNDNLEEDEDDWEEGNAEGEDDDDADSDTDDLNDSVATASAQNKDKEQSSNNVDNDAEEEPQTRGKKRKLDD